MTTTETTGCPCCGEEMDRDAVVCWECYRSSDRLTPGTYPDGLGTWTLTAADVDRWDVARTQRLRELAS